MALAAAQVVSALAARLMGATAAAARVYTNRNWPLAEAGLPAWRVYADGEQVEPATIGNLDQHRLSVACEGTVRDVEALDDELNDLAAEGLTALFAGTALHWSQLESIERRRSTEGEAAVGRITLRIGTLFHCVPGAPETIVT